MQKATVTGVAASGDLKPGPGTCILSVNAGGSTYQIQAKHPNESDSSYKTLPFPNASGSVVTSSTDDVIVEGAGNLVYRLNVTSYVADATIQLSSY